MNKFLLSLILLTTTYISFAQRRQKTTEDINPIEHFFETGTYTVSKGLFNAYEENNRWYFEIPDSLLNREIMAITRYIKPQLVHTPTVVKK